MSNLVVNIRFGLWHLQISRDWGFRIAKNPYLADKPHSLFKIYEFFGYRHGH